MNGTSGDGASADGARSEGARPGRVRVRRDFLLANRGVRVVTPAFILLVRARGDGTAEMRTGFTVSKRVGNAVARNRAKRRLREAARAVLPARGVAGADHVLIARRLDRERPFPQLLADLDGALRRAQRKQAGGR